MATYKKELPNDLETERTVLGLMITDDETATKMLSELNIDDFAEKNLQNRLIFQAIQRIKQKNETVDYAAVVSELRTMNQLESAGGSDFIFQMADEVVPTTNYHYYVRILKDTACLRELISSLRDIENSYEKEDLKNINDFISLVDQKVTNITRNRRVVGFKKVGEIASIVSQEIINRVGGDTDTLAGIGTGFSDLDNLTNGFKKGELIYMAARPAVGKTALGLNICYNVAKKTNKPVLIFELEMQGDALFKRILSSESQVSLQKLDSGYIGKDEKLLIGEKSKLISKVPVYINDSTSSTIENIEAQTKRLKNELGDIGLIMIDYIGIIADSKWVNKNDSRQNIVQGYSRKLKALALELNVPILVLSQLRRTTEERDNKRPTLSDLRESGSLEQDADKVILLYRPQYYVEQGISIGKQKKFSDNGDTTINKMQEEQTVVQSSEYGRGDVVDVILAKNRSGKTGVVSLLFYKECGKFVQTSKDTQNILNSSSY